MSSSREREEQSRGKDSNTRILVFNTQQREEEGSMESERGEGGCSNDAVRL